MGRSLLFSSLLAGSLSALAAHGLAEDGRMQQSRGHPCRKDRGFLDDRASPASPLSTLVDTHTPRRVLLTDTSPHPGGFDELLADRVTGEVRPLDPRLLALLRSVARRHPGGRIELVSGFRSPKLNEMLRKKGHHVASQSQHSLGHAIDFRVFEGESDTPVAPLVLEKEIRNFGWLGGTGTYEAEVDRFIHCDVGPNRRWTG